MYEVGDKFEIEIDRDFIDENDNRLYRIKGFNSLVFDENGLKKLKKRFDSYELGYRDGYKDGCKSCETVHKNNAEEPIKTVKASELTENTKVICWSNENNKYTRCFAFCHNGRLYAYYCGRNSNSDGSVFYWEHMTLEDGTVVLPE